MGLTEKMLAISDPLLIKDGILKDMFIVSICTDERVLRITYNKHDSSKNLENLLAQFNVHDKMRLVILKSMGFKVSLNDDPASLAGNLPGINLEVKHPVTGKSGKLYNVIISLNDSFKWSRESIADWIENTCETSDISFKIPEGKQDETDTLSSLTKVVEIKRVLTSEAK
jgi:hypothetical protein